MDAGFGAAEAISSFRRHRHDVLNALQLVRAYIQMERAGDALRVVDRTARWLQSLTVWQTQVMSPQSDQLVFAAAVCAHVTLRLDQQPIELGATTSTGLCHLLTQLDDLAGLHGVQLDVEVAMDMSEESGIKVGLAIAEGHQREAFAAAVGTLDTSIALNLE